MTLKRPIVLRALARPTSFFGMHLFATVANTGSCIFVGVVSEILYGVILWVGVQAYIAVLTRKDPYFGEVWYCRIKTKKTKRLNSARRGNYYAA